MTRLNYTKIHADLMRLQRRQWWAENRPMVLQFTLLAILLTAIGVWMLLGR